MRTLNKNKTALYYVNPVSTTEVLDDQDNYTGIFQIVYSTPKKIKLSLYPSTGEISEQIFGKSGEFDMIAVSIGLDLLEDTLLFVNAPTKDFDITYDYKIDAVKKSLNVTQYGLKKRRS